MDLTDIREEIEKLSFLLNRVQLDEEMNEEFYRSELNELRGQLSDIAYTIMYLQQPVAEEGILRKMEDGCYRIDGIGREVHENSLVEVWVDETGEWFKTRVGRKSDTGELYFPKIPFVVMEGRKVRLRAFFSETRK